MTSEHKDDDPARRQAIRSQIDENLRRVYTAALNEEVPDRFKQLLDQLRAAGAPGSPSGDKGGGT